MIYANRVLTLYNVCSVHRGDVQYIGGYIGGAVQYIGGAVQYIGGMFRGYHEYIGGIS